MRGPLELFNDNKSPDQRLSDLQITEETIRFDPLTGIGNRPHIETKIRSAMEDFHVRKCPFGILFIDVDHFKDFNDQYGHLLGDKILRMAANTLRQNLRGSNSCGRWGGEEFIALVHDLDRAGLAKVAEKLRQCRGSGEDPREGPETERDDIDWRLVGPAVRRLSGPRGPGRSLMYESKRRGRNRVTSTNGRNDKRTATSGSVRRSGASVKWLNSDLGSRATRSRLLDTPM